MESFTEGMVSAFICQNAESHQKHTERDCAYTLIVSPMCASGLNHDLEYLFEFHWNGSDGMLQILLNRGTTIYFSAYGITHRQVSLKTDTRCNKGGEFWNICSYANKHLFENVMTSFMRFINKSV